MRPEHWQRNDTIKFSDIKKHVYDSQDPLSK